MITLFSSVKLQAAAKSMHQFCNAVRAIYPADVRDDVVEAATGYLYLSVSSDVFGRRAAQRLRRGICRQLKYLTPTEFTRCIERLALQAEAFRVSESSALTSADEITPVQLAVNSAIRSMLIEAGLPHADSTTLRECFPKFGHAAERIKSHLAGIRRQNRWLIA